MSTAIEEAGMVVVLPTDEALRDVEKAQTLVDLAEQMLPQLDEF